MGEHNELGLGMFLSMEVAVILVFVVTILERVFELFIAQRNRNWSLEHGGVEFGSEHYKWMVVLHTTWFFAILWEYVSWTGELPESVRMGAMLGVVFTQSMRWWIITTLGKQWNTRVIVIPGYQRVTSGPYKYFNHPNYAVVVLEMFLLPLVFGSWKTAIIYSILNGILLRERIKIENFALEQLKTRA